MTALFDCIYSYYIFPGHMIIVKHLVKQTLAI